MDSDDFTPIVVTTTSDDRDLLLSIGKNLVEKKLAACVQISGPITSCYHWEGKVETAQEWQCVIKTSRQRYEQIEVTVRQLHNYDQPQMIAMPIIAGSLGYLSWMQTNLDS